MATVEFILAGVLDVTPAIMGTGSASGSFSGSLMEATTLLFTAPSSGKFNKMFSFDISAGSSIILASSGMVIAMASASSPSGSATAIASDSGTSSFLTSSSGISLVIAATPPSSYMLAVTGDSPPTATGLASFSVVAGGVTLYKDSLTTRSRTVALTGNTSLTLVPNVAFTSTGSSINEADANVVPEPSTLLRVLTGVLKLGWLRLAAAVR